MKWDKTALISFARCDGSRGPRGQSVLVTTAQSELTTLGDAISFNDSEMHDNSLSALYERRLTRNAALGSADCGLIAGKRDASATSVVASLGATSLMTRARREPATADRCRRGASGISGRFSGSRPGRIGFQGHSPATASATRGTSGPS